MRPIRSLPLAAMLALAVLAGCDVPGAMLTPAGEPAPGQAGVAGDDDLELAAFLGDRAELEADDGAAIREGAGALRLPVSILVERDPQGPVAVGTPIGLKARASGRRATNMKWEASHQTSLVMKGSDAAAWTPHARRTSALKITARSSLGGKGVYYLVAFTDGKTVICREVTLAGQLPASWLGANDPFRVAASPSPIAAPQASAAPSAALVPVSLGTPPACGPAPGTLTKAEYLARRNVNPEDYATIYCLFKDAIRAYPDDYDCLTIFAHAAHNHKLYAEAMPAIEHALAVAPGNTWVIDNAWVVIAMQGIHLAWDARRWADGALFLERALLLKPNDAWGWASLGIIQRNAQNDEAALRAWQKAYALEPAQVPVAYRDNFLASLRDGIARLRQAGKTALAIAYAELGLNAYPAEGEFREALIALLIADGQTPRAQALVDAMPASAAKQVARGTLQLAGGDETAALATFRAASRAYPADWDLDSRIAKLYRAKVETLPYAQQMASPYQTLALEFNHAAVPKYFRAFPYTQAKTFTAPLSGTFCVYQGAGGRSFHNGLTGHYTWDMGPCGGAARGTSIRAIAAGTVVEAIYTNPDKAEGAEPLPTDRSNVVAIDHGGLVSRYVHLQQGSGTLNVGDRVGSGQAIGKIGNSGYSTGSHLHFEVVRKDAIGDVPVPATFTGMTRTVGGQQVPADRLADHSDAAKTFAAP